MQTDLPLKLLTTMRATDLLPLLGIPAAEVLEVVVRELPMKQRALDTLLRIRSPQRQEYLHLLEWQGYPDAAVLWRVLGYLSLVGQEEPHITIVGTIVYLTPADDQGDTLTMVVDGEEQHRWSVHCIRLWEQDAQAALATGNLALTVLSPLMAGADASLVEAAAQHVLAGAPPTQQADLLVILGVFAARLLEPEQFLRIVRKEQLMSADLIDYLVQEIVAEHETRWQVRLEQEQQALAQALAAERQAREAERQALAAERQAHVQSEQEALEAMILLRFPDAPLRLTTVVRQIRNLDRLRAVRLQVPTIADLTTLEQQLLAAAAAEGE